MSRFDALGRWPVVNLEVTEDFQDEPTLAPEEGAAERSDSSATPDVTTRNGQWLLRIHTDIAITQSEYRRIHTALSGKKHKEAYDVLLEGALDDATPRGAALVKAAFGQ